MSFVTSSSFADDGQSMWKSSSTSVILPNPVMSGEEDEVLVVDTVMVEDAEEFFLLNLFINFSSRTEFRRVKGDLKRDMVHIQTTWWLVVSWFRKLSME